MARRKDEIRIDEVAENTGATVQAFQGEIPDKALELLKVFSNYAELYITSGGGVYTPDCKHGNVEGAILYKNPFYNS